MLLGPAQEDVSISVGGDLGPLLRPYVPPAVAPRSRPRPRSMAPELAPVPTLPPPPDPRFVPEGPIGLTLAYPPPQSALPEGATISVVWNTGGAIKTIKLVCEGDNCPLGGRSRGRFSQVVAKGGNQGVYRWKVPWMDTTRFRLRLIGFGGNGKEMTQVQEAYSLLPLVCQRRPATALCVSKSRQRLYYLRDGSIRRMHVISTAAPGYWTPAMRPGSYDRGRGAMGRVFYKSYAPVSRMYEVVMYHWLAITSSGSHGIHATSPGYYRRLGRPASHGCIRQHRADARALWETVSVGTPVYVM